MISSFPSEKKSLRKYSLIHPLWPNNRGIYVLWTLAGAALVWRLRETSSSRGLKYAEVSEVISYFVVGIEMYLSARNLVNYKNSKWDLTSHFSNHLTLSSNNLHPTETTIFIRGCFDTARCLLWRIVS